MNRKWQVHKNSIFPVKRDFSDPYQKSVTAYKAVLASVSGKFARYTYFPVNRLFLVF